MIGPFKALQQNQGQSLIEATIFSACMMFLVLGFLQLMLFFSYQHITQFLSHETLICMEEKQLLGQGRTCVFQMERSLKKMLLFTDGVQVFCTTSLRSADFQVHWKIGVMTYQKKFSLAGGS